MRQCTHERSVDTDKAVDVLRGVNNDISYEALCAATGLTLTRLKQVLASARRILEKRNRILFGVVWGLGLHRMLDSDIAIRSDHAKKRANRHATREGKRLDLISNYDKLSKNEQQMVAINRIVFSVIKAQTRAVKPEKILEPVAKPKVGETTNLTVLKPRRKLGEVG